LIDFDLNRLAARDLLNCKVCSPFSQGFEKMIYILMICLLTYYLIITMIQKHMISRLPRSLRCPVLSNLTQECMHFLLQLLLQKMLVCSLRHIWSQGWVSMLQRYENTRGRTQVPMKWKRQPTKQVFFVIKVMIWSQIKLISPQICL
jgi:hypothetical protein